MSDPIAPTAAALLARLSHASIVTAGVAATSIHFPYAPSGRTWPYILLECLDAPEEDATFTGPTWTRQIWAVRVVTVEDVDQALAIASAVNDRLEGAELTISGYRHLCCMRLRATPPRPVQGDDSVIRIHAGGEYTIGVGES